MRINNRILENLNSNNKQVIDDQFGTVERELFKLKNLVNNEKTLKFIRDTVLELNNFRMDYWNGRITDSDNYEELINKIDSIIRGKYGINDFSYDIEDNIYMYYDDIPEKYYENSEFKSEIEKIVSSIVKSEFTVDFSYSEYDQEPMYNLNITIYREEK